MTRWPLTLRLVLTALPFAATIAAFAHGRTGPAVLGIALSGWTFHRLFLSDL